MMQPLVLEVLLAAASAAVLSSVSGKAINIFVLPFDGEPLDPFICSVEASGSKQESKQAFR